MRSIIVFAIALCSLAAAAGQGDDLLALLRAKYPGTQFTSVMRTEMPSLYEIRMGENIAYTDTKGDVWLFGHLFDMRSGRDLTAERQVTGALPQQQQETRSPGMFPPDADAIIRVNGNGKRRLVVYSDSECPYCRQVEKELVKLNDVTILVYPVAMLSDGFNAASAWCAKDRAQAWDQLMSGRDVIREPGRCDSPVASNTRHAVNNGIRGVPTLVRSDGDRIAGFANAGRIESWLSSASH